MTEELDRLPQAVFDEKEYLGLIEARGATIRGVIKKLEPLMKLSTAVDAGCGVGFFSQVLHECGMNVRAFDGRAENIDEARRRYTQIPFEQGDIQDSAISQLGSFDLVLCFGLLYHLESPLAAIRNLRGLTQKCLLLESMCLPEEKPFMLLREEPSSVSQSLTDLAFYPSEGCLVKMCYRAGFKAVFRVSPLPDHEQFRDTRNHLRRRTVLLALPVSADIPGFQRLEEPIEPEYPWDKIPAHSKKPIHRMRRFFRKPIDQKISAITGRIWNRRKRTSSTIKLSFGALWIARDDHIGRPIAAGKFEGAEYTFVDRFLRPGMTVLDVGAHHGFYTLLSSTRVGSTGRVFSFEPSERERKSLQDHVSLNRCGNVNIQGMAVGNENKEVDLYLVNGDETGCNSLRPPVGVGGTSVARTQVTRLDDWITAQGIERVDFIKLDVEGGEREALQGAEELIERFRPAILAEVYDLRTRPWGYAAREIVQMLAQRNYRWFRLTEDGSLQPVSPEQEHYEANLVALPAERADAIIGNLREKQTS